MITQKPKEHDNDLVWVGDKVRPRRVQCGNGHAALQRRPMISSLHFCAVASQGPRPGLDNVDRNVMPSTLDASRGSLMVLLHYYWGGLEASKQPSLPRRLSSCEVRSRSHTLT
jgi:hypothetical protein